MSPRELLEKRLFRWGGEVGFWVLGFSMTLLVRRCIEVLERRKECSVRSAECRVKKTTISTCPTCEKQDFGPGSWVLGKN
jgi:hypothetical protein